MKLLKTILNYLKNLFKKKELSLTDLVPQLKDIDHDKLFEQIRPGDIVFGITRCDNLEKIEESHRIRPFIVAKKKAIVFMHIQVQVRKIILIIITC